MILINLLPAEFRVQEKTERKIPALKIILVVAVLFGVVTIFLYVDFLKAKGRLRGLDKEWAVIQPQSGQLRLLEQEVEATLKPENEFLTRFVTSERPFTHMLVWVSEFLPDKSWLLEVKLSRDKEKGKLFVKGLALPSKELSSIQQIETYLNDLKKKIPDAKLSLTTTRLQIQKVIVTQFVAHFEWGSQETAKA